MLFQRSCSNDIITQAQPPSYSTQAWTIPSVLIYFKTPHQPAGQTFKIALWRSLVWSSGVIFSCLFCFFYLWRPLSVQTSPESKNKTKKANDFLIRSCESASSAADCQAQPSGGSDLILLHFQGACCTACLLLTPPCSLGVGGTDIVGSLCQVNSTHTLTESTFLVSLCEAQSILFFFCWPCQEARFHLHFPF